MTTMTAAPFSPASYPKLRSPRFLFDSLPRPLHMPALRPRRTDAQTQGELAVQLGVREIQISAGVERVNRCPD